MNLDVYCRHELIRGPLDERRPAMLLEGSWAEPAAGAPRWSLDESLDARFQWIDLTASRLAEQAAQAGELEGVANVAMGVSPAWLNELALRYYLVKLLRVTIFFTEIQPLAPGDRLIILAQENRDEDYLDLLEQLCRLAGAECQIQLSNGASSRADIFPPDEPWRRWMDHVRRWFEPRTTPGNPTPRIVLCGNPRLLEPICHEALQHECAVWWLYDRLAIKAWWRWRRRGVGQLVCNSGQGRDNRLRSLREMICQYRGVDLGPAVAAWLQQRLQGHGPRQTRLLDEIDSHFHRIRPNAIVLDEDATPMPRAAIAVARRHGIPSLVVQHGAPACRFGFAPLAADRVLVWGHAAQRQLEQWGVSSDRIRVTGSPLHEALFRRLANDTGGTGQSMSADRPRRILLLATVPPRDDRPDSIALHLTHATYAGMLRTAFGAVARLDRAELIVKLHPRSPDDPAVRQTQAEFPQVRAKIVHAEPLEHWLCQVDCVLSCISSAGIDAALSGLPVVQLLPEGCGDVLPHAEWGLLGSARKVDELEPLLTHALATGRRLDASPNPNVFGSGDVPAASRILKEVLAYVERPQVGGHQGESGSRRRTIRHTRRAPNSEYANP